eukprot:43143_1
MPNRHYETWIIHGSVSDLECNANLIQTQCKLVCKFETAWIRNFKWFDEVLEKYKHLIFRTIEEYEDTESVTVEDYINGKQMSCNIYKDGIKFYWEYYGSHIPNMMEILFKNGIVSNGKIIAEMKYTNDEHWPS